MTITSQPVGVSAAAPSDLSLYLAAGWRELVTRARRVLGNREDAEDVVQDLVLRLLEATEMLAPVEHLGGWLLTVVRRRAIDALRAQHRRQRYEVPDALVELLSGVDDPAAVLESDQVAAALANEVAALPAAQREAFVANAIDGVPFRELAERTGTPMGTLMARKKRAVDRLRARLTARGMLPATARDLEDAP